VRQVGREQANDGIGVCRPRPSGCSKQLKPTCGCDGQVHPNECEANAAGVDVSNGGCEPPPGMFACGPEFCSLTAQFCDADPEPPPHGWYACTAFPADCGTSPSCTCLADVACGNCMLTTDGGLMVSCAAG
jgi:hypothetical protein